MKVVGNLKGLISEVAVTHINLNKNDFKSNVPGPMGVDGPIGPQGISVHHIKGTSTTDNEGDFGSFGEVDTYTVYGDANETINLGFFRVNNGATKEGQYGLMYKSTYDTTANGIVDNSEKLEGRTIAQIQADITDTIGEANGIASLDTTAKLDRAQVPVMNVSLGGDVNGSFTIDGTLNTTVNVVVQDNSHAHTFSNLTATPTTLSGYGITDADTSTQVSAKISTAVAALVDSSPATLDTLNELAAALGDDPNFATTTSTALGNRVVKNAYIVAGTGTKITYDTKGLVTGSTTLSASDIPSLDASKITSGTLSVGTSGNAATATRVNNTEVIKFDTGVTEGTDLYTFDGSVSKTINIKAGTNVTLTKAAGSVTINANDTSIAVTEITGMGAGASTFLATPTSTNLAAMLTDETGTGAVVFANSPTLTGTPLATTAVVGTNTTQVATTAYVIAEINKIEEW